MAPIYIDSSVVLFCSIFQVIDRLVKNNDRIFCYKMSTPVDRSRRTGYSFPNSFCVFLH